MTKATLHEKLLIAINQNRIDVVKEILNLGVDPNAMNGDALIRSINLGAIEIVSLLLDRGADVNRKNMHHCDESWPICQAVKSGNLDMVNLLLDRGADINIHNGKPLILAVKRENLQMVRLLIERGADVWGKGAYVGKTGQAFYEAVDKKNFEIFKELFLVISKSPHTESTKSIFHDLLVYSIRFQFKKGIDFLLENDLVRWLSTPLSEAIIAGDLGTIENLLSKGAQHGNEINEAISCKKWDILKFLISKGLKYNPNECLKRCVESPELVEFFIKQKVDAASIQSAFENAVYNRCKRSAQILLENGATPTTEMMPKLIEMGVGIFGL